MSVTVFDLDDLCDAWDPYEELVALKEKYPGLKVTLFAIPGRCSDELLERYRKVSWAEIGVHGYYHSTMECAVWGYDEAQERLEELEGLGWAKLFKAPGWETNPQLCDALFDRGWKVADHAGHVNQWSEAPLKRYCHNSLNGFRSIHGHTWETCDNGPSRWPGMFDGVEHDAEFKFVSEVCEERNFWVNMDAVRFEYENSPIHRVLDEIELDEGELVVDLGAYTGAEIQACTERGLRVLSFEPQESAFRVLMTMWGGREDVELVRGAAWVEDGEIELYENDPDFSASKSQSGASLRRDKVNVRKFGKKVPCFDIGKVLEGKDVGLLKMNVEGAEWEILERILQTCGFGRIKHVYVEDHDRQIKALDWVRTRARVKKALEEAGVEVKAW